MRPAEFSPEEIVAAGEALVAAGRNVTGFALRQKVGGGNPNRLKQVWDEHLAAKNTTEAEPVAELPVEVAEEVAAVTKSLTERLATLAVELNDKAVKAAERRVAEVLRTAGEQREQAERELVDAAQTVDELETRLDESQAEVESLERRLSEAQSHGQAQAVELAQLRERLAASEQAAKVAAETHARELELAHSETKTVRAELDVARREAAEARESAAKLAGQLEAVQAQNATLLAAVQQRSDRGSGGK
ncbi:DNA-binding protein [Escherichia coli]|nr:DNA-binding protein [Escherichia coli]